MEWWWWGSDAPTVYRMPHNRMIQSRMSVVPRLETLPKAHWDPH